MSIGFFKSIPTAFGFHGNSISQEGCAKLQKTIHAEPLWWNVSIAINIIPLAGIIIGYLHIQHGLSLAENKKHNITASDVKAGKCLAIGRGFAEIASGGAVGLLVAYMGCGIPQIAAGLLVVFIDIIVTLGRILYAHLPCGSTQNQLPAEDSV